MFEKTLTQKEFFKIFKLRITLSFSNVHIRKSNKKTEMQIKIYAPFFAKKIYLSRGYNSSTKRSNLFLRIATQNVCKDLRLHNNLCLHNKFSWASLCCLKITKNITNSNSNNHVNYS